MAKRGRRAKRNRPLKFDEMYTYGPIQFGRAGRLVVGRSNLTPEEHKRFIALAAENYFDVVARIDGRAKRIQGIVSEINVLHLLQKAYFNLVMSMLGITAEFEIGNDQTIALRMIDYVQSVIAATSPSAEPPRDLDEGTWAELCGEVRGLFHDLLSDFFICQAAYRKSENQAYDRPIETLFAELQMWWVSVRGDRHTVYQIPHIVTLLEPHDPILRELFGVSAADLGAGLRSVQTNLLQGLHDTLMDLESLMAAASSTSESSPDQEETHYDPRRVNADDARRLIGRLIGYDLFDVAKTTDWPREFIRALAWAPGEDTDFFRPGAFAGWPLRVWPIFRRPFIMIDEQAFCFDAVNIFDRFYRQIQRLIFARKPEYRESWNTKQSLLAEKMPVDFLVSILQNATSHRNVYYRDRDWCEVDAVVIFGDVLFAIEVKAGAFVSDPPMKEFEAYFRSVANLLTKPATQAHRFLRRLAEVGNLQIFDGNHVRIGELQYDKFRVAAPVCVTLDNMSQLAARTFTIGAMDPSLRQHPSWSVSIDDLRVFKELFDSPSIFCHFVEQRLKATRVESIPVPDELDHVGLYFTENHYVEKFSSIGQRMSFHGYTSDIDTYYHNVMLEPKKAKKPGQKIPFELRQVIEVLDRNYEIQNVRAVAVLLDYGHEAREGIAAGIQASREEGRAKGRAQIFSIGSHGDAVPVTICCVGASYGMEIDRLREEALAEVLRQKSTERLVLLVGYDVNDRAESGRAWFVAKGDLGGREMSRLVELSEAQAQRRISRVRRSRIGRNDSCPCGSGKKFKRCCIERM